MWKGCARGWPFPDSGRRSVRFARFQGAFHQQLGEITPPVEHGQEDDDTAIEPKAHAVWADEQFPELLEAERLELRHHASPPGQGAQRRCVPPQVFVEGQGTV